MEDMRGSSMALFNRSKFCVVEQLDNSLLEARGTFTDTYHEINLTMQVSIDNMEIVKVNVEFVRTPQKYCLKVLEREPFLLGIIIGPGLGKAIMKAVGGETGCVHLADLALDLAKALIVANNKLGENGRTIEEINDHHIGQYGGTCYHWTEMGRQKQALTGNNQ